ncbi:MAG: isoleucine--tRNA ligase [Candidatus Diapherotrites archaeon]|nr:isoleucine--tRNA ligase [Candidatus Diapherotrites archaeon]
MQTLKPYSLAAEEEVRQFWEKNRVPQKARTKNKGAKKTFYLIDGPPYASGHIHMGTALNKVLKDIAMRMKRMQGFEVRDQPGYDTHGLPIENKVEAKLGFKNKKQIEEFGVEKFVNECKKFATEFIEIMNGEFYDLGVWMDWENPYLTLDDRYIESMWWTFSRAHEKGLLYLGKYSVHVCPRCETAVAFNEIEYAKQTDDSVYVKFPVRGENRKFLVIWTTTPWTLPGNTGVMANPGFDYVEAEHDGQTLIIAKAMVEKVAAKMRAKFKVKKEFSGKQLVGLEYTNPLKDLINVGELKGAYRVIPSEKYVDLAQGTGLVHTAPGHGKEDFEEGTKHGLPVIVPVELNGTFNKLGGKYEGKKARPANTEIIKDLKEKGAVLLEEKYTHDYPFCWRCKNPLLMLASPQWFFRITGIRKRLMELNEEVYWTPPYGRSRFENWLESLSDWPVSRQRYWGTPLPIWVCGACGEKKVVSSKQELKKLSGTKNDFELHKPWIDKVTIKCRCGGEMKRVPEVLDVWFDSGPASWSSLGYPQKKGEFEKFWPADLNIEGKDQIRGWWNSQLITSVISFDKKPFKAIAMHGLVLDMNRNKMSKSQGNIITPHEAIAKHNRDFLRYFLASESRGEDFSFDWNAFKEIARIANTFHNTLNYYMTYYADKASKKPGLLTEDKWLLSRLGKLEKECLENYNNYTFSKTTTLLQEFILEDLSRTYIQIIRDREDTSSASGAAFALKEAIHSLLRLTAPLMPHFAEHYYRQVKDKGAAESVHLLELCCPIEHEIDEALEKEMGLAKEAAQAAFSLREELGFRRRWPLKKLVVKTKTGHELSKTLKVLAGMCNVMEINESTEKPTGDFAEKETAAFALFIEKTVDDDLRGEWEFTELRRQVQEKRKQAGLNPREQAILLIDCDDREFLEKFRKRLEEETLTVTKNAGGKLEKLLDKSFYVEVKKA